MRMVTWNMARGNVQKDDVTSKVRALYLSHLVKTFDVAFIQEAPKLLREKNDFEGKFIYKNGLPDGQQGKNACKSVVITGRAGAVQPETQVSGGLSFRYPVTVEMNQQVGGTNLIVSSVHNTSNNTAASDLRAFTEGKFSRAWMKTPYTYEDRYNKDWLWVVGGDFNFDNKNNNLRNVVQPDGPTQQTGGTLDGFYVRTSSGAVEVLSKGANTYGDDPDKVFVCEFKTLNDANATADNVGFWVTTKYEGKDVKVKLSDHSPVEIDFSNPVNHNIKNDKDNKMEFDGDNNNNDNNNGNLKRKNSDEKNNGNNDNNVKASKMEAK